MARSKRGRKYATLVTPHLVITFNICVPTPIQAICVTQFAEVGIGVGFRIRPP
jgi:hypothetical protein